MYTIVSIFLEQNYFGAFPGGGALFSSLPGKPVQNLRKAIITTSLEVGVFL